MDRKLVYFAIREAKRLLDRPWGSFTPGTLEWQHYQLTMVLVKLMLILVEEMYETSITDLNRVDGSE